MNAHENGPVLSGPFSPKSWRVQQPDEEMSELNVNTSHVTAKEKRKRTSPAARGRKNSKNANENNNSALGDSPAFNSRKFAARFTKRKSNSNLNNAKEQTIKVNNLPTRNKKRGREETTGPTLRQDRINKILGIGRSIRPRKGTMNEIIERMTGTKRKGNSTSRDGRQRQKTVNNRPNNRPIRGTKRVINETSGKVVRPRTGIINSDAENLINDFTHHLVKNNKDPLVIMKQLRLLGSKDKNLMRKVMNENSPYDPASNLQRLSDASGPEARRRIENKMAAEEFINYQKDRLRKVLSLDLSRFTNDQLRRMFTVPMNEFNALENVDSNYDSNFDSEKRNINVALAFKILGIPKDTATKTDAVQAKRKLLLGKDPRFSNGVAHPNKAPKSKQEKAQKATIQILEAFEVAKKYIETRGKPKSDIYQKGSKGPVKKKMNKNKLKNQRKQTKQKQVSNLKRLRLAERRQMTQNSLFDGIRSSNEYPSNDNLLNF